MGGCANIPNKGSIKPENIELIIQNPQKNKFKFRINNTKDNEEILMLREQVMKAKALHVPKLNINSSILFQKRHYIQEIVVNPIVMKKIRENTD